jgi:hypothetical protein
MRRRAVEATLRELARTDGTSSRAPSLDPHDRLRDRIDTSDRAAGTHRVSSSLR